MCAMRRAEDELKREREYALARGVSWLLILMVLAVVVGKEERRRLESAVGAAAGDMLVVRACTRLLPEEKRVAVCLYRAME